MAIGTLSSSQAFSSMKHTGSVIASPFVTTTTNQQRIDLVAKDGKPMKANAVTITAGTADLYVSFTSLKSEPSSYSWIDEPVYYIPAEGSVSFNGLEIAHIKFSNASGAQYLIQAFGY